MRMRGRSPAARIRRVELMVSGLTAERIGDLAFENAVRLHELAAAQASLEQAFMELTGAAVEFRAAEPQTDTTILTGSGV